MRICLYPFRCPLDRVDFAKKKVAPPPKPEDEEEEEWDENYG
jgi:hypothetical protein